MDGKKRGSSFGTGIGAGYVSVIMIFVMITLTVLAALSFSASGMNVGQDERSREHMAAFYEAEGRANTKLMQIDEAAYDAANSGLFMTFEESAAAIEGVTVSFSPDGYDVSWSEKVSDRVALSCAVTVFSSPELHENRRYEVTKWETVSGGEADTHINVWDGTF